MTGHLNQVFSRGFYKDPGFDYTVRCVLGAAASGGAEVGEVLATIDGVPGGDHEKWFHAWRATGQRCKDLADAERAAGRAVSASSAYLRAATYFSVAVDAASALEEDDVLLPTFRLQRSSWDGFVDTAELDVCRVEIPYEGTSLPGYWFHPGGEAAARPTVIMVNGSDGATSGLWHEGASAALARGYNALLFDGPGQQAMLFEKGIGFRPDWAPVLAPVIDFVLAQDGVDPEKLVVYGISQAGYWVADALRTEHRPAAAVLDPGVVDVAASWEANIPSALLTLFHAGKKEAFDRDMALGMRFSPASARLWKFRARAYGKDSYFDTLAEVSRYSLSDAKAAQITTPLILTDPEREQFWPGQTRRLAAATGGRSQILRFTTQEGADFHCEPMARDLVDIRVFACLDALLGGESPGS